MTANILGFEDPLLEFLLTQATTISISLLLMLFAGWITTKFLQYTNRLIKVESDTGELKTDMKFVKKRLTRIEKKLDRTIADFDQKLDKKLEERISPIERKLDKLISYLITTKQVDKDALG